MPRMARALIVVAAIGILPVPGARAQTAPAPDAPKIDVSFGLTIGGPADANVTPTCTRLGLPCEASRTFPDLGVAIGVAQRLGPSLSLAVDAGLIANRWRPARATRVETNYVRSILAGPRIVHAFHEGRGGGQVFVQLLGGAQWNSVTPWRIALQPGAGVDFRISTGRALRVQYDHCYAPGDGLTFSGPRFQVALVLSPRD
jgi:hypothetical protein